MRLQRTLRWAVWLVLPLWVVSGCAGSAEHKPTGNPSVGERIGTTAKKAGNKIEQGFTKAAKKIEQKNLGQKVERKLKKAARKTAEWFKKTGRKIDQKLRQ